MKQATPKADAATSFPIPNFVPALNAMQKEFFDTFEGMNREWVSRIQSEAKLASDFVSKLTAARSIPDAASAYLECATRQFEMFTEDSRRMLANSHKLMETGTRLFSAPQIAGT
jgi:hypothetical protein